MNISKETLLLQARTAAKNAYAPYSNFHVGCAIELADGTIITGTNIENASYGLTICAERNALHHYAAHHNTKTNPVTQLAVTCPDGNPNKPKTLMPCGACRQVIQELAPNTKIHVDNAGTYSIEDLLPESFTLHS